MSRLQKIQAMLADEPHDPFLNYSLGMELAGQQQLQAAIAQLRVTCDQFSDYIPAYHQLGRLLLEQGEAEAARPVLEAGIQQARRQGNDHAAGEMAGLLDLL